MRQVFAIWDCNLPVVPQFHSLLQTWYFCNSAPKSPSIKRVRKLLHHVPFHFSWASKEIENHRASYRQKKYIISRKWQVKLIVSIWQTCIFCVVSQLSSSNFIIHIFFAANSQDGHFSWVQTLFVSTLFYLTRLMAPSAPLGSAFGVGVLISGQKIGKKNFRKKSGKNFEFFFFSIFWNFFP